MTGFPRPLHDTSGLGIPLIVLNDKCDLQYFVSPIGLKLAATATTSGSLDVAIVLPACVDPTLSSESMNATTSPVARRIALLREAAMIPWL